MWKTYRKTIRPGRGMRALFSIAVAAILSELKPHLMSDTPLSTGIRIFDRMTREQQIAAIHEVGTALIQEEAAPPESVAYRQATLLALFDCIGRNIRLEILENKTPFRSIVLAVHREKYGTIDHGIDIDCTDLRQWNAIMSSIRKEMVEEDFLEISEHVSDLPPELAQLHLSSLGVSRDYQIALPDDPAYFQIMILATELFGLCKDCLTEFMQNSLREKQLTMFGS